jgi:hypothetical protein
MKKFDAVVLAVPHKISVHTRGTYIELLANHDHPGGVCRSQRHDERTAHEKDLLYWVFKR